MFPIIELKCANLCILRSVLKRERPNSIRLVHLLRKVKSSTSVRTRCFRRLGGNRLVRVSSAIPWRLAQNSSDITSALELCPGNNSRSWENAKRNSGGVAAAPKGKLLAMPSYF
jgi:hypothetical protein